MIEDARFCDEFPDVLFQGFQFASNFYIILDYLIFWDHVVHEFKDFWSLT